MDSGRFRDPIIQPMTALARGCRCYSDQHSMFGKNIAFSAAVPALLRAAAILPKKYSY
jgi:hypothetical protein